MTNECTFQITCDKCGQTHSCDEAADYVGITNDPFMGLYSSPVLRCSKHYHSNDDDKTWYKRK